MIQTCEHTGLLRNSWNKLQFFSLEISHWFLRYQNSKKKENNGKSKFNKKNDNWTKEKAKIAGKFACSGGHARQKMRNSNSKILFFFFSIALISSSINNIIPENRKRMSLYLNGDGGAERVIIGNDNVVAQNDNVVLDFLGDALGAGRRYG